MSQETSVILRQMLYHSLIAKEDNKDINYLIRAITAMCTKDDVAAVKEQVAEELADRKK